MYMMVKIEFCDYILTFDDLECWLELNEEEPFTTIVVGTISTSKEKKYKNKTMPKSMLKEGVQKYNVIDIHNIIHTADSRY